MGRFVVIGALSVVLCAERGRPSALKVPSTLGALELSDIVWVPALTRYVLVTDESPFLVTMSADGVLDGAPLRIPGVESLDDAEALASGPDGSVFLATSHSPNKKGVRFKNSCVAQRSNRSMSKRSHFTRVRCWWA
jgi:hypothetical protein